MAIRNPFKNKMLRAQFDAGVQMFEARHKTLFASDGNPHRLNGFASPFWRGYYGELDNVMAPKWTLAYAMLRSGQACRSEFNTEFKHDGKTIPLGAECHYPS